MNDEIESSPPVVNKNCKLCGIILKAGRKNYCSYEHKYLFMNSQWEKECEFCKKKFILPLGRRSHYRKTKDKSKVFCGRQCFVAYWHDNCKIIRSKIKEEIK